MQSPEISLSQEQRPETEIEGKLITGLLEVKIDETGPLPLSDIIWTAEKTAFLFRKVGNYTYSYYHSPETYPLYEGRLVFKDGNEAVRVNLSQITQRKRCLFTGSYDGFFMHNPEWEGKETDFYIIGLRPSELEGDIYHQVSTYHELGHALIADDRYDVSLYEAALRNQRNLLPPVAMASSYAQGLRMAIPKDWQNQITDNEVIDGQTVFKGVDEDPQVEKEVALFHERCAWAAGICLQRRFKLPIGFLEKQSQVEYARFCLSSYADFYQDKRFVESLKSHKE